MSFPVLEVGADLVMSERWQDMVWSAVPGRVIASSPDDLVVWVPAGVVGTFATNRGLPGTEHLTRDERKLLAMRSLQATVAESAQDLGLLLIYRSTRWARINLGWDSSDHHFLGWYVNFERPAEITGNVLTSKDLVLDLWVEPDRSWRWKDRPDYESALDQGIFDASVPEGVDDEVVQVLAELDAGAGPFAGDWCTFRPDPSWPTPRLPAAYAWGGSAWSLPPGRRVA